MVIFWILDAPPSKNYIVNVTIKLILWQVNKTVDGIAMLFKILWLNANLILFIHISTWIRSEIHFPLIFMYVLYINFIIFNFMFFFCILYFVFDKVSCTSRKIGRWPSVYGKTLIIDVNLNLRDWVYRPRQYRGQRYFDTLANRH